MITLLHRQRQFGSMVGVCRAQLWSHFWRRKVSVYGDAQTPLWSEPSLCFVPLWHLEFKGNVSCHFSWCWSNFLPHDGSSADLGLCLPRDMWPVWPCHAGRHLLGGNTGHRHAVPKSGSLCLVHTDLGIFGLFFPSALSRLTHHCLKPYSSNALTGKYQLLPHSPHPHCAGTGVSWRQMNVLTWTRDHKAYWCLEIEPCGETVSASHRGVISKV